MNSFDKVPWPRFLGVLLVCQGAGGIGAIFTNDRLKQWYPSRKKPWFNPPRGVFAPVWTMLYLLIGIAEYLVSQRAADDEIRSRAERVFALHLGLNVGWSFLLFKLRSPFAALVELIALWVAIVLTIATFARISRLAALPLVPCLLWTTFAAVLNASIWWLNRSNGRREQ